MAGVASSSRQRSKIAPYLMILPALAYLGVFFVVPFFSLFRTSLSIDGRLGLPADADVRLGLRQLRSTRSATYQDQIIRSFIYALAATVLCLLLAYPLAYVIAFKAGRYKNLMLGSGDPAVLRDVPDPHDRVEDDPGRRRLGGQRARHGRPAAQRGPAAVDQLGGDRRPDLQLDHLHDPAAVRQPGEDRSAAARGVEGPLLVEQPQLSAR